MTSREIRNWAVRLSILESLQQKLEFNPFFHPINKTYINTKISCRQIKWNKHTQTLKCMLYLPTFTLRNWPFMVGKYAIHSLSILQFTVDRPPPSVVSAIVSRPAVEKVLRQWCYLHHLTSDFRWSKSSQNDSKIKNQNTHNPDYTSN